MSTLSRIKKLISHERPKFERHYAAPSLRIFREHTVEVLRVRGTMDPFLIQQMATAQLMKQYEQNLVHTVSHHYN